jgi:hypothetical protein
MAYSQGGGMALRGVIPIPQSLFFVLILVLYFIDARMICTALKEAGQESKLKDTIDQAIASKSETIDAVRMALRQPCHRDAAVADVAERIVHGEAYGRIVADIITREKLSLGDGVIRYRKAIELLGGLGQEVQKRYQATGGEKKRSEFPEYKFQAVLVRRSAQFGKARLRPGYLIVSYKDQLVTQVPDLIEFTRHTGTGAAVSLWILQYNVGQGEWMAEETQVSGGELPQAVRTGLADTSSTPAQEDGDLTEHQKELKKIHRKSTGRELPAEIVAATAFINGPAQKGLVLGVFSILASVICGGMLLGPIGVVWSIRGRRRARELDGEGARISTAGLVTSIIGSLLSLSLLALLISAFEKYP